MLTANDSQSILVPTHTSHPEPFLCQRQRDGASQRIAATHYHRYTSRHVFNIELCGDEDAWKSASRTNIKFEIDSAVGL
jgi:hypothetical protein